MKKKGPKKQLRIRFLTIVMLLAILAAGVSAAMFGYTVLGKGSVLKEEADNVNGNQNLESERQKEKERLATQREEEGIYYIPESEEKDLDRVIVDESDAFDVLKEIQYDLGIMDAEREYKVSDTKETDGQSIYTMQQYHDGIEVYGSKIKLTTNESGYLMLISGEYKDLGTFSTEAEISESDAKKYVEKYLKSEYQYDLDVIEIKSRGKKICTIDSVTPTLSYMFDIVDDALKCVTQVIVVDAKTGGIVCDNFVMLDEMVSVDLQGQTRLQENVDVNRVSDTRYQLIDENRNIIVGSASSSNITRTDQYDLIEWDPQNENPNPSGVDAIAHVQKVYDYYNENHQLTGLSEDDLNIIVNVENVNGRSKINNASMSGTYAMIIAKRSDANDSEWSYDLNTISHEYTHGVVNSLSSLEDAFSLVEDAQKSAQLAIHEGIADTFAEFIEDYVADENFDNSCDWIYGSELLVRDIANPDNENGFEAGAHLKNAEDFISGTTDCHFGSTIISHSAYLMAHGDEGIDGETLNIRNMEGIWYNAIPLLDGNATFPKFRKHIESQAILSSYAVSDDELECIIDSFDRTGIQHLYNYGLTPESTIQVYDQNNELYDNYNITVTKLTGDEVLSADVKDTTYELELDPGIYKAKLTDLADEELYITFSLIVNDNDERDHVADYKENESFFTEFGSDERQVALVLDVSGSMNGTPIEETKQAAIKFVERVLEESPNSKISIITYAEEAGVVLEASSDIRELRAAITGLDSGGGTNMYDAMSQAKSILDSKKADKKLMFVMSDGLPNEGTNNSGDYNTPVIELADDIKAKDTIIYSLGFFHNLSGEELESGTNLMAEIASTGYHYNVSSTDEIQYVFSGIAYDISGENYILIRIECPVDVTVQHNGETLSSAEKNRNISTEFGLLSFEGEKNEKKILRLRDGADYEICINGTGTGTMDYTISYPDENGDHTDERTFRDIPITKDTVIVTSTEKAILSRIDQDTNGNGTFDQSYVARKNGEEIELIKLYVVALSVITILLIVLLIFFKIKRMIKRRKEGKTCPACGAPINKATQFCGVCGRPIQNNIEEKKVQSKKVRNFKIGVIVAGVLFCLVITILQRSAAMTVLKQLKNNQIVSAQMICKNNIKDSKISEKYLTVLLEEYMDQVMKAYGTGEADRETAVEIYHTIYELDIEDASVLAEEYIEMIENLQDIEMVEE